MSVAAPAPPSARRQKALPVSVKVPKFFCGRVVVHDGPHRQLDNQVLSVLSVPVGSLAVPAAPGDEFAFVTEFQQGVDVLGAFQVNIASPAAVAAARSAARHELLTAKSHAAVSAITACDLDFCFVNKHRKARPEALGPE